MKKQLEDSWNVIIGLGILFLSYILLPLTTIDIEICWGIIAVYSFGLMLYVFYVISQSKTR